MNIKTGMEGTFAKFLEENSDTMEKRMRNRFLLQWMAMVEMGVDGGGNFDDVTKQAYDDLKDQFGGMAFSIPACLNIVAEVWEYGAQLKEWYNRSGCTSKVRGQNIRAEVCITKHARSRMHTRCGLNRKAQDKIALKAFQNGLPLEEAKGYVKEYMVRVLDHTEDKESAKLRLYGDKIFIFKAMDNCNLLITVMQVPNEYIRIINMRRNAATV